MKPFLKWVGGKQRIIDEVIASFPSSMHNYREPFVGGGSVLLRLLELEEKTPRMVTADELVALSRVLRRVTFECCDFRDAIAAAQPHDFLYCDPPYYPLKKESFIGYNSDGFDADAHSDLFRVLLSCRDKRISFALSNADVPHITELFCDYKINKITVTRAINAKNPAATAGEVIIY